MSYQVKMIANEEQINTCELFQVDNYQWSGSYRPKTYGRMGILNGNTILVLMTTVEKEPLRRYTGNDEAVYEDSAMEAFFNFSPDRGMEYVNFEVNANGAMLSAFGDKHKRKFLKERSAARAVCKVSIGEDSWNVLLRIPMELIYDLYGIKALEKGGRFTCNFYKISEDPAIEHYASFSPIESRNPNFHLPEFFEDAIIA